MLTLFAITSVLKEIKVKQNVGRKNFGGLAINRQIHQGFLPQTFCVTYMVIHQIRQSFLLPKFCMYSSYIPVQVGYLSYCSSLRLEVKDMC